MNPNDILANLNDEIYERFKTAVELGKWPDGKVLTAEQKQTCMQAMVIWENAHVAKTERTGYVPPKKDPCADDVDYSKDEERPIRFS